MDASRFFDIPLRSMIHLYLCVIVIYLPILSFAFHVSTNLFYIKYAYIVLKST